jgi:hypothetical protein
MIGFVSLAAFLWQERYKSLAFSGFLLLGKMIPCWQCKRRPCVLGNLAQSRPEFYLDWLVVDSLYDPHKCGYDFTYTPRLTCSYEMYHD